MSIEIQINATEIVYEGKNYSFKALQDEKTVGELGAAVVGALYSGLSTKTGSLTIAQRLALGVVGKVYGMARKAAARGVIGAKETEEAVGAVVHKGQQLAQVLSESLKNRVHDSKQDMTSGDLMKSFKNLSRQFSPIESLKYEDKVFTRNNFAAKSVVKDKEALTMLRSAITELGTLPQWFATTLASAQQYEMTNGSRTGAETRIRELTPLRPNSVNVSHYELEFLDTVYTRAPLKVNLSRWLSEYELEQDYVPTKSSAGFPYIMKNANAKIDDTEILVQCFKDAEDVLKRLTAGGLNAITEHMAKNVAFYSCQLKPKLEKISVEDYWKKARVYYVTPGWYRVLAHRLWTELQNGLQSYRADPYSWSAYGHSWFYGGATAITEHFTQEIRPREEPLYKALCFGDDALGIAVTKSGKAYCWAPDVRGMDFGCSSEFATKLLYRWVNENLQATFQEAYSDSEETWSDIQYGGDWKSVLQFCCWYMANGPAHLDGPLWAYLKGHSAKSGTNGVTVMETITSIVMQSVVKTMWETEWAEKVENGTSFGMFADAANERLKALFGFGYKRDDDWCEWPSRNPDGKPCGIPLPFLGFSTRYEVVEWRRGTNLGETRVKTSGFVPVARDPHKILSSLWLPGKMLESKEAPLNRAQRIFGISLSGLGLDPYFNAVLNKTYNKTGAKAAMVEINGAIIDDPRLMNCGDWIGPNLLKAMYLVPAEDFSDLIAPAEAGDVKVSQESEHRPELSVNEFDEQLTAKKRIGKPLPGMPRVVQPIPTIEEKHVGGKIPDPKKAKLRDLAVRAKEAHRKARAEAAILAQESALRRSKRKNKAETQYDKDEQAWFRQALKDRDFGDLDQIIEERGGTTENFVSALRASHASLQADYNYHHFKGDLDERTLAGLRAEMALINDELDRLD